MILVTGGTGYIGSHACVALMARGHDVVIVDNLCNSRREVLVRLATIAGKTPLFYEGDVRDAALLDKVFAAHSISAVFHFAGLKAVGESTLQPLRYYDNNISGTLQLLLAMTRGNVKTLIFSSSATVYGVQSAMPIREDATRSATNPYGRSKLIIEDMLTDLHHADSDWKVAVLRYFNPTGAHESGLIGESPLGTPNNLVPLIAQVASGQRAAINVWGNAYATPDGTGVRDYVHVMDLVEGHLAAFDYLESKPPALVTANLGTGRGTSVLEMIHAFERASGKKISYRIAPPRAGDAAQCWAATDSAHLLFHWRAKRNLDQMCADAWRWQLTQS
jgi:UDP-glucose 4-epimerase